MHYGHVCANPVMEYKAIATQLIAMKEADLACRQRLIAKGQLHEGYNTEMAAIHDRNASAVEEIINKIGYPTTSKVGKVASEAAWLIIQHAIGRPLFMKKCLTALQAAAADDALLGNQLAYLSDRIAVLEGKPQLYGTQFDWDEAGQLSPCPMDDLAAVNLRRATLGWDSLEERTSAIRRQAQQENQRPPSDLRQRNLEMAKWKRSVGWTT